MKRYEVDNLVGKGIIVTVTLIVLMIGTMWVHNGYENFLMFPTTTVATIVISVICAILAVAMVGLGLLKNTKYYLYATCSAIVAIFFMLLKVDYEIKQLVKIPFDGHVIRLYMIAIAIFGVLIIANWVKTIVKIVKN